ncbi:hypothetical protein SDC9_91009 [bioreactor metagenome]|uniref:Uncharacterized protein n=1 Tax=bioreactor metagenome TaxID=1076179 RepID=A0A644ZWM8_9ZZZZ
MAVKIPAEVLGGGVLDALVKAHHSGFLADHINQNIGGDALAAVIQPLDDVAVYQIGDPHGALVVVDLSVIVGNLKLADHVVQFAQLAVAQLLRGGLIQHGDCVE